MLRSEGDGSPRVMPGGVHRDDYFMIGVVYAGRYKLSVDFEDCQVSEGQAIIIAPGQVHAPQAGSRGDGFVLALSPELLTDKELAAVKSLQFTGNVISLPRSDLRDIVAMYEILRRRSGHCGDAESALVSAIKSIVIDNIEPSVSIVPHRYQRLAVRLQQLMELHIRSVKSPAEYADRLHVSGVYLNEAVKAATGQSVSSLIGRYVTVLAKRELCYTRRSVQQIAGDLGYEDYSYFSRLFRRYAGISPTAFRGKYLE
ncbi:MAG: AraC family transcriptional regulator [Bacteroides sp.]|nr:AraC family transcriptional regulator [Bacteroides sp.]